MTTSNTITKADLTNILNEILPIVQHTARVGEVSLFAGSTAPTGWLICDGSAVSRTTYSALFAVIGTTYGTGDGSTTFNLPDFRDNFPVGAGSTYSLNSKGGSPTVTLDVTQIPSHNHAIPNSLPNYAAPASGGWLTGVGGSNNSYNTGDKGGGKAHENRPPYIGINFIIYAGTDAPSITELSTPLALTVQLANSNISNIASNNSKALKVGDYYIVFCHVIVQYTSSRGARNPMFRIIYNNKALTPVAPVLLSGQSENSTTTFNHVYHTDGWWNNPVAMSSGNMYVYTDGVYLAEETSI